MVKTLRAAMMCIFSNFVSVMKHISIFNALFLFIGVALSISSCQGSVSKIADITDEVYAIPHDSLYVICKDLSGLNDFRIGMTLKQVKATKLYRSQNYIYTDNFSFISGKWKYYDHKACDWIIKNCKGEIKQLHPMTSGNFKIGDLEFSKMDLAFLHDTLVAVCFYPDKQRETVLNHYKEKYGNGNGRYYKYYKDNEPCRDKEKAKSEGKEIEEHLWENERVALKYYYYFTYTTKAYKVDYSYGEHYYLVYDKKRYPVFEDLWKGWEKKYEEHVKNSNESSLNSL